MDTMMRHEEITITPESRIIFHESDYRAVIAHCKRKLSENYIDGESRERKAFGLIGGRSKGTDYIVEKCFPLLKNARHLSPYDKHMDSVMAEHAIPSETPLEKRGWIADPRELLASIKLMMQDNLSLLGAYHMHRVSWPDDPLRDTPTVLDTVLAADSRMLIFIISLVAVDRPVMRAFYEGRPDMEVEIIIKDLEK